MAGVMLDIRARELWGDDAVAGFLPSASGNGALSQTASGSNCNAEPRVRIASAGVSAEEQGNPMDRRAVKTLANYGYDTSNPLISHHRAHRITPAELEQTDLYLAMTQGHRRALINIFGVDPSKIKLWREFEFPERKVDDVPDLADPWYGDMDDFAEAFHQLVISLDAVLGFADAAQA
jgi:protein-tyrosine phosphatase